MTQLTEQNKVDPRMNETDPTLPRGLYDVMVIDVQDADESSGRTSTLSLVVVSGEMKGHVITLDQPLDLDEPLLLLGCPGSLTVGADDLRLQLED